MNWIDNRRRVDEVVTAGNRRMKEPFAFCGRIGDACGDLLIRVFSTHLIGFLMRATKQEGKSAL